MSTSLYPHGFAELVLARRDDPHTAILFGDGEPRRWSYAEFVDAAARRASLAQRLLPPGGPAHIAICLDNHPEYLFWIAAASLIGATVIGVNTTRPENEIHRDLGHVDTNVLVTDQARAGLRAGLALPAERVLLIDSATFAAQLDEAEANLPSPLPDPDTQLLLLFTSGSTGAPKAVRCSTGRLAERGVAAAERYGFSAVDMCYSAMPLFHGNALMGLWAPAVVAGAGVAIAPRFTASGFIDDVRRFDATYFNYVGRSISYILATPRRADDGDNRLRFGYGTEASWKDIEAFAERFGCPLGGGYGMSEGGGANIVRVEGMPDGALGVGVTETLIVVDPDTLEECPPARLDANGMITNPGEAIGEIVNTAGVAQFEGYYNNPEANAERTRNGWFWTGDLAYRDERGYFWFAGRSGDKLRVDSENFSAAPIEAILHRFAAVRSAVVYAVPDPDGSDAVVTALELHEGARFDAAEFSAFLAAQPDLAAKWVPQFVRITAAIPLTGSGKVSKQPLRAMRFDPGGDQLWWRPTRRDPTFVPFDDAARSGHLQRFVDRGRQADLY